MHFSFLLGSKEVLDMYLLVETCSLIRERERDKILNKIIYFSNFQARERFLHESIYIFLPFVITLSLSSFLSFWVVHVVIHLALLGICLFSDSCPGRDLLWEPRKVSQLLHSWAANRS